MLLILTFVKYMLDSSGRNFWTPMSQFLDVAIINVMMIVLYADNLEGTE